MTVVRQFEETQRSMDAAGLLCESLQTARIANVAVPPDDRSAMAIALGWSATITTISAEMVVPGLVGYWLDQRFGTRVVFLLLGFGLGGTLAALALAQIARKGSGPSDGRR